MNRRHLLVLGIGFLMFGVKPAKAYTTYTCCVTAYRYVFPSLTPYPSCTTSTTLGGAQSTARGNCGAEIDPHKGEYCVDDSSCEVHETDASGQTTVVGNVPFG